MLLPEGEEREREKEKRGNRRNDREGESALDCLCR